MDDDPVGKIESIQYMMNILFFIPHGVLFPCRKNQKSVLVDAVLTSVLIEFSQYVFVLGECELDDVISNTIGGMIGFCIFIVLERY